MQQFFNSVLLSLSVAVMTASADDTASFKITTKRDDDKVVVKAEKNKAVICVQSPFGISNAVIERTEEKWPETIVLRLHLRGLENFQITNGKVKLEASMSSQDNTVRVWKDGKEESPLNEKSPYWMEVRKISNDRKPAKASPLKGGYFELDLPRVLLEDNSKSISVHWIDFYR